MKKIFICIMAAITMATSLNAKVITREFNNTGFTGLEVSSCFKVELTKSDNYSVVIELDDDYDEYLIVKEERGRLVVRLDTDRMPKRLRRISNDIVMRANISMPVLYSLKLSGASQLKSTSTFESHSVNLFTMSLSGASKVNDLSISGTNARIGVSGASKLTMKGCFVDIKIEGSGASSVSAELECGETEIELSGASKGNISGKFADLDIDCSGASKAVVEGTAVEANYHASGASSINAENLEASEVDVEVSGASSAKVNATKVLEVESSGASSCSYVDNGNIRIKYDGNRSSSLRKIR